MIEQFLPEYIQGERISLKKLHVDLADKLFQYVDQDRKRLAQFLPWPNFMKSVNDEIDFINEANEAWKERKGFHFGIFRNSDNEYMGNIGLFSVSWINCSLEMGYWILGKFEGNGYMTEAVRTLEKTLFEMGFNRLVIRFDPLNKKSGSIPRRLNYVHEGTLREVVLLENNKVRSLSVCSKLKSDYEKEKQNEKSNDFKIVLQSQDKGLICEKILRSLPLWFGIESAVIDYVNDVVDKPMLTASNNDEVVGFISLLKHNDDSAEIFLIGVIPQMHNQGIGKRLLKEAEAYLKNDGVMYLQVKTLGPSRKNKEYEQTRKFYESVGFSPLEELKDFWCEDNPCLIMVKKLI